MSRNLAAWTGTQTPKPNEYVPYVSVNEDPSGDVGFTVRNPTGETVTAVMDWPALLELTGELNLAIAKHRRRSP